MRPSISSDGRYVAFETDLNGLVEGDNDNSHDIFIRDRVLNTTTPFMNDEGQPLDAPAYDPVFSDDGLYLTFTSNAENIVDASPGSLFLLSL